MGNRRGRWEIEGGGNIREDIVDKEVWRGLGEKGMAGMICDEGYEVEVWGWKERERERIEGLQEKYLKLVLGME